METWGQLVWISKRIKIALILGLVILSVLGLIYLKNILVDLIFREYLRYWPAQTEVTAVKNLSPKVMVKRLAEDYSLDPDRVYSLAELESQFNCRAKNPKSTAGGLFQFLDSTWINKRQQFGLDPDLNLKFDCFENARTALLTLRAGEYHHWQSW